VLFAGVAWAAAGLVAVGSTVGAQLGAHFGRSISDTALRWTVVSVGVVVAMVLIVK
jgi:uncharacterized membrane protein YfcA